MIETQKVETTETPEVVEETTDAVEETPAEETPSEEAPAEEATEAAPVEEAPVETDKEEA